MDSEIKITATFDDDTKRMHRFIIDDGQVVSGSIYLPKGSVVPDVVIVRLRTQSEAKKEV